jgi:hypothetical protein
MVPEGLGAHRLRLRHREQQKLRVERSKRFLIGRESGAGSFSFSATGVESGIR